MANIFISFLSTFGPFNGPTSEPKVFCSDSNNWFPGEVSSRLAIETGFRSVNKLLEITREKIDTVILICTEQTKNGKDSNKYFRKENIINEIVEEIVIDSDANQSKINEIFRLIKKGDNVYLDITSGLRFQTIHYSLISNILPLRNVNLMKIICSDQNEGKVIDYTNVFLNTTNIINGIIAFNNSGNSRQLCNTLTSLKQDFLINFTNALKDFSEAFLLSKPNIDDACKKLQKELEIIKENPDDSSLEKALVLTLIPIIETKIPFLSKEDISILDTIEWAADNYLLVYALTIFIEYMPKYYLQKNLLSIKDILHIDKKAKNKEKCLFQSVKTLLEDLNIDTDTIEDIKGLCNRHLLPYDKRIYFDLQKKVDDLYKKYKSSTNKDDKIRYINDIITEYVTVFPDKKNSTKAEDFPYKLDKWNGLYGEDLKKIFKRGKDYIDVFKKYNFSSTIKEHELNRIFQDYEEIRVMRNMVCHCSEIEDSESKNLNVEDIRTKLLEIIEFNKGI
jgi:hypothetical protein